MKPRYRTTHLEGKTRAPPPPLPEFQNNQVLVGHSRFRSGKQALLCEPGCSPGEALGWHSQEDFPVSTNQLLVTQLLPEPKPPCNVTSLFLFFFSYGFELFRLLPNLYFASAFHFQCRWEDCDTEIHDIFRWQLAELAAQTWFTTSHLSFGNLSTKPGRDPFITTLLENWVEKVFS